MSKKANWKDTLKQKIRLKLPSAGVLAHRRPPELDGAPSTVALEPLDDAAPPSNTPTLRTASSSSASAISVPQGVDTPEPRDDPKIETSTIRESTTSPNSNLAKIGQVTLHGIRNIVLPIAEKAVGAIPLAGPPLKAAIGGLLIVLDALDQKILNKIHTQHLIERLKSLEQCALDKGDGAEEHRRRALTDKLGPLRLELEKLGDASFAKQLLENKDKLQTLLGHVDKINQLILDYVFVTGIEIKGDTEVIRMRDLLNGLLRTRNAGWNSQNVPECSENTRVGIQDHIKCWLNDSQSHPFFWMYGLAGTGKTTIAYSLAKSLASERRLGASFFCSRAQAELSNMEHIFPFLAFQLAMVNGDFRRGLLRALEKNPNAGWLRLESQINELLVNPLKCVSTTHPPIVVVVDALDECQDNNATSEIVSLIARHVDAFSCIKLFVTSRPENRIIEGFRRALSLTQKLALHDINLVLVKSEIKGYLQQRLEEIRRRRQDEIPVQNWPPKPLLDALAERCGGFWIFASTACTFIDDEYFDPHSRLETIANVTPAVAGNNAVYNLYDQIFELAFKRLSDRTQSDSTAIIANVKKVVTTILLLFNPLSIRGIAGLLELQISDIRRTLKPLTSVIILPEHDDTCIRIFHTSFHDFLAGERGGFASQFHVNSTIHHRLLTLQCLLCLQRSSRRNSEKNFWERDWSAKDIPTELDADIYYSSRHWIGHLEAGTPTLGDVVLVESALGDFLHETLPYWMKCLFFSFEGDISSLLKKLQSWLSRTLKPHHQLIQLFHDNVQSCLSSICNSFMHRAKAQLLLQNKDLDKGIVALVTLIKFTPDDHQCQADRWSWLGDALLHRLGDIIDIDNAIVAHQSAVLLTPDGHADKPGRLSNLGNSLLYRSRYIGDFVDIDGAISVHLEAVHSTPDGHANKPLYLHNLGNSFLRCFERSENLLDMDKAINFYEQAVNLTPDSDPYKPLYMSNLGKSFTHRFQCDGNLVYINRAIAVHEQAIYLTPDGHTGKPYYQNHLGTSFQRRFESSGDLADRNMAITHFRCAATHYAVPPSMKLHAALNWARLAAMFDVSFALQGYTLVFDLLPQVVWLGQTMVVRDGESILTDNVASEAAATAIAAEKYDTALEWLEQGRSMLQSQLLRDRTPIDVLREVQPSLADDLVRVSKALEHASSHSMSIQEIL